VASFLAQPGRRTITGMLVGARLAGRWHHARAHRFYAAARWSPDALGRWVVLGVLVRLSFLRQRAVCLPVLARLWRPHQPGRSKLKLACALVGLVTERHPDRRIHLVADAAYAGRALRELPPRVTVTTRLRRTRPCTSWPHHAPAGPAGPPPMATGCPSCPCSPRW
jgi:hypothetical protein